MKILFTGDVNCSRLPQALTPEKAEYAISEVKSFFDKADFRVVNMEEPMGDAEKYEAISKSGPNLIAPAENICLYEALNTDIAVMANNHIGDYGQEATKATLELAEKHGIKHIGAGKNIEEAYKAEIVEKDGIKVSIIATCENEFGVATENTYGSAGFNALRLCTRVKEEKEKADYVIVIFHGGDEKNPLPSLGCRDRYRLITEFGADAVIAMHTHCPQGYEYYKGKPIVYSMGNFFFQAGNEDLDINDAWFYGYMTMASIDKDGIKIEVIPYRFDNPITKITVFEGEDKQKMMDYLQEISDYIQDDKIMKEHYMGWIIDKFQWKIMGDPKEAPHQRKLNAYKNTLTCEAHNELTTEGYRLYMAHEVELANSLHEAACEREKMPVKW